jgi:hypothetical protein
MYRTCAITDYTSARIGLIYVWVRMGVSVSVVTVGVRELCETG